ncbi:regulator of G-protein signaling 2-like [Arapaima gigas]
MDTLNSGSEPFVSGFPKEKKQRTWASRFRYFLQNPSSPQSSSSRKIFHRPTLDEVNQWAKSFDCLLSHKYGQAAFSIFLKSEFCEENLQFWLACQEYKKTKSLSQLRTRARSIYEEFVKSESPKEVNLDFHTKEAIAQSLQWPALSCFYKAQQIIYSLMENSSYPRFIESELYKELCARARRHT